MTGKRGLQDLVREAGITVPDRQPCLPAPVQPAAIASDEDHALARSLLVQQRKNDPDFRDPSKQLKRIFRSSKEKERLQDTDLWEFSQDELDRALSAVVDQPATSAGLVQAFLNLGAKVNYVEAFDEKKTKGAKKPNVTARRRSTVLQRAATVRRADEVSLLAGSGADQTALDEALKAALAATDHECIRELLRHGADINKFPNALADAVRSNDQNLVRLLLRAPKALRSEVLSSCLPAAVQQKSEAIILLLIGYSADPNFDSASALNMAISQRDYRLAVSLVAGSIPLTPPSLQALLDPTLRLPTAQELGQYLQLLLYCGLPPGSPGLARLLISASKRNDSALAMLLVNQGVSTDLNEAECLRNAIAISNWTLADAILATPVSTSQASAALATVRADTPRRERLHIISALVSKGARGKPLEEWLVRAVEDGDTPLIDLLLNAGAPLESGSNTAIQAAVARKDMQSLRTLLNARPSPSSLARVFPLIRSGYTPTERRETICLLLKYGARGPEVDQALLDAVGDTSTSRDVGLITELVKHNANVNYNNGQVISLTVSQADMPILHLLCGSRPSSQVTSAALPLTFDANGGRRPATLPMIELLLSHGFEEGPMRRTLGLAIKGGPENMDIVRRLITADARLLGPAFQFAVALDSAQRKVSILRQLLKMGVPQEAIDQALIFETRYAIRDHNDTVLRLLIDYGASINYNNGEALSIGVGSGSSSLLKLLLSGREGPTRASITKAFRSLFHGSDVIQVYQNSSSRVEIARELLTRGVDQPIIDSALRANLDPTNQDENSEVMTELLLDYHADVNTADGTCFTFAAKQNMAVFKILLGHRPDYRVVVPTLVASDLEEEILIKSLQLCFDRGCTADSFELHNLGLDKKSTLALALQCHPRCEALVKLLLAQGCNPDITVLDTIDSAAGNEALPILVWALARAQKIISSSVILALLEAGASSRRSAPVSEISPIALAAREGRPDIVQALLNHGADASVRDRYNRSALFYASSSSLASVVQALAAYALRNDGSLHEAARCLQLDVATILVKAGHNAHFPSRLHGGRTPLGELCLNAEVADGAQRTKARQLIRLLLDNGADAKFRARNERSAVTLALDNPHSALEIMEALLETEVWEDLNDQRHMFHDTAGLWYSPCKYVELVPSPSRAAIKHDLLELLRDKGCQPRYYSENAEQPDGAIGMPAPIAMLADRRKEHQLSLKLAAEANEHARMLEEATHRDLLRRKKEQQDADAAAAAAAQAQWQALEQQKHDFEVQRLRSAERTKRSEKAAWHSLIMEQERDAAAQRLQIEDRKASAAYTQEAKMIAQRQSEMDYRAGVERRALKEKEELYERNVKRQMAMTQRIDESAQLHAKLRQERPALEGAQWGSVD